MKFSYFTVVWGCFCLSKSCICRFKNPMQSLMIQNKKWNLNVPVMCKISINSEVNIFMQELCVGISFKNDWSCHMLRKTNATLEDGLFWWARCTLYTILKYVQDMATCTKISDFGISDFGTSIQCLSTCTNCVILQQVCGLVRYGLFIQDQKMQMTNNFFKNT